MEDRQSLGEVFVEDFLEHHGVKGMKWGVRKSKEEVAIRKEAKKERMAKLDSKIRKAKARVKSGESKNRLNAAKLAYKEDKILRGKKEAKKALNKAKAKYDSDLDWASTASTAKGRMAAGVISTALAATSIYLTIKR